MPSRTRAPRSPRSFLVLALLAAMVAVSTAGATLAHQPAPSPTRATAAGSGAVEPAVSRTSAAALARDADPGRDYDRGPSLRGVAPSPRGVAAAAAPAATAATPEGADWISRAETDTPAPRPRTVSTVEGDGGGADAATFSGRNRVWIPALGIRRSVSGFACSSSAYPGDRVYRWGCAGRNNVYLFGHAHSVFKPLHDAYVRGNLRKGMKVHYANSAGSVSTYKVVWWKVTTPDKGAFAYAAQSRPSMTLQTCVGAKSQYRLIVRLVKTG